MAKLGPKIAPRGIRALTGIVDVYYHVWTGWVARQWPRAHRPSPSVKWRATTEVMKAACKRFQEATTEQQEGFKACLPSAPQTWADKMRSSALSAPPGQWLLLLPTEITVTALDDASVQIALTKPPGLVGTEEDGPASYTVYFSPASYIYDLPIVLPDPPVCLKSCTMPKTRPAWPATAPNTIAANVPGDPTLCFVVPWTPDPEGLGFVISGPDRHGIPRIITGRTVVDMPDPADPVPIVANPATMPYVPYAD